MNVYAKSSRMVGRVNCMWPLVAFTAVALWITSVISVSHVHTRLVDLTMASGRISMDWGSTDDHRVNYHWSKVVLLLFRLHEPWQGQKVHCANSVLSYGALIDSANFTVAPWEALEDPLFWNRDRLGLSIPHVKRDSQGMMTAEFPLAWPALIASAWFLVHSYRNRRRPGFCRICGYDLTGNVSGVCPECGTVKPQPRIAYNVDMHAPSRARRIFKWTGVGSSLAILAVWIAGMWHNSGVILPWKIEVGTESGMIYCAYSDSNHPRDDDNFGDPWETWVGDANFKGTGLGFPRFWEPTSDVPVYSLNIPFWLPLLLTAIPTARLWHRDRRRIRPGCCPRCGYNLTGKTSGVCSEYGEKSTVPKPPPATV